MLNIIILFIIAPLLNQNGSDLTKYKMFLAALENHSTAPNYILITVTNLVDGKTKELCTEAPFLEGALYEELGLKYSIQSDRKINSILKKQKNLHFSFTKKKALENIGYFQYDDSKLSIIREKYKIDLLINTVIKNGQYIYTFKGNQKDQIYLAHILLLKSIMVTRGCLAGNILTLELFKK